MATGQIQRSLRRHQCTYAVVPSDNHVAKGHHRIRKRSRKQAGLCSSQILKMLKHSLLRSALCNPARLDTQIQIEVVLSAPERHRNAMGPGSTAEDLREVKTEECATTGSSPDSSRLQPCLERVYNKLDQLFYGGS